MKKINYLFASTNLGCEDLLETELINLGAKNTKLIKGGIYYQADEYVLYEILIWSRIASRIFLCITQFKIRNVDDLYINTYNIDWEKIFSPEKTFLINFKGTNHIIRNSLFGALKIKDAIVDFFYKKNHFRPNIDRVNPDVRIKAMLFNDIIYIMLDLSGESLHKRGYAMISINKTPIKENLSASIVLRSGWDKKSSLIDPMCGSGTLLIEAAMIASDRAPGLKRKKWGFQSWIEYKKNIWKDIKKIALERFQIGIKRCNQYFLGYDYDHNAIKEAKKHALNADVDILIKFLTSDLNDFKNNIVDEKKGTIISNPPYGERYQTENQLVALYIQLGFASKKYFIDWNLSIFSSSIYLLNFIQMKPYIEFFYKNGPLNCVQRNYNIFQNTPMTNNNEYYNRLNKNFKKLKKWACQEKIECFRVYDADLPNYNIIVDIYKNWIVIQEYQAPKVINHHIAYKRLCDAIYYTKEALSIPINNIVLKFRKKQKNRQQYQKLFNKNSFFTIKEYNTLFWVNVTDYLDTGLFSDKRRIRKLIYTMSNGKNFLNLFSYTGTASVSAGLGRAKSTTSIDISNTYIQWSIRNMSINNLTGLHHRFIQADCLDWLKKNNQKFDLIFINPPTFSNSKRMEKTFELKKDYLYLITHLKRILAYNGNIIFSSSTNNFNMDLNILQKMKLSVQNITKQTQSKDFFQNFNKYNSWIITHIQ